MVDRTEQDCEAQLKHKVRGSWFARDCGTWGCFKPIFSVRPLFMTPW